jgi:hypothetical protein
MEVIILHEITHLPPCSLPGGKGNRKHGCCNYIVHQLGYPDQDFLLRKLFQFFYQKDTLDSIKKYYTKINPNSAKKAISQFATQYKKIIKDTSTITYERFISSLDSQDIDSDQSNYYNDMASLHSFYNMPNSWAAYETECKQRGWLSTI